MFKVECPGCNAPYQVDERRVPASGLQMRCPKCGTSFQVQRPEDLGDRSPAPGIAAALGVPSAPPGPQPPAAPAAQGSDVRRTAPKPHKATMLGVASGGVAPLPGAPPAPAAAAAPPLDADPFGDDPFGEIDLPAPAGQRSPEAVRTAPAVPRAGVRANIDREPALELDADLPSPVGSGARGGGRAQKTGIEFGEVDLPAAVAGRGPRRTDSKEFELPPRASAPARDASTGDGVRRQNAELDLELPSLRKTAPAGKAASVALEADLPGLAGSAPAPVANRRETAIGGFGEIDLPSPAGQSGAGGARTLIGRGPDLPAPRKDQPVDLPSVGGGAGLPAVGGPVLPAVAGAARSIDLPSPTRGGRSDLPAPRAGTELPALSDLPRTVEPGLPDRARGFGELDLPGMGPPGASTPLADEETSGTAHGYGSLGLDDRFQDAPAGDAVQLQSISSAPPAALPAGAAPVAVSAPVRRAQVALPEIPGRRSRKGLVAAGGIALLVAAGAALALVPDVGPYGYFLISDQIHKDAYAQLVKDTAKSVRAELASDTFPAAKRALATVTAARARAKRVRALPAYAAFVGYVRELRFGVEPDVHAQAEVLLADLDAPKPTQYLPLALAAQAAANGQLARARQLLIDETRGDPNNIDLLVLRGEMELRARDAKAALVAWQDASRLESSARTAFGLARAHHAASQNAEAEREAREALKRNPEHVGARVLLARVIWETSAREAETLAMLDQVLRKPDSASKDEIVRAQTLVGDVHLARSRVSQAEAAYTEALKLDPKAGHALSGLGDALYLAGRNSEALARFEAAIQADPDDLSAKIGAAKTQIALERLDAASATLKKLRQTYPQSLWVAYWNAKVEEALGKRDLAEADYRSAISLGAAQKAPESDLVDAYVALAMLLGQLGRVSEAQQVLDDARSKLAESPAIHKALGEVALAAGRYDQAIDELGKALALDPKDVGAKFRLGVAYRRNRQFDQALKIFDEVSEVDRDHPGLALERGMLYEDSGRSDDALKAYESALAKAPNDLDLMLRVGCVKAAGGGYKEAQELLQKVLDQRADSAETHHCLGRALLAEGSNLAGALKMLEMAVQLDPNRPEYHLYVGWAAGEAGHLPQAEAELGKALALDQGLADAYWRRGVLKSRQGAFRDAVVDLTKALSLRPTRFEAHAALADAYSELGREADALVEWDQAVRANPNDAQWQYRFGKLLTNNNRSVEGQAHLRKAIDLGTQATNPPRWLWDADYMMARAIGSRPEATPYWENFLRLGPSNSPYREDAKRELKKFGHPWNDE